MWPGLPRSGGMRARSCSNGGRISPRSSATIHSTRWGSSDPDYPTSSREEAINMFVAEAACPKAGSHFYYRRPSPGFHPHVYAFENRDRYDAALINPLAHFIRAGKPEGPWKSELISPGHDGDTAPSPDLRVGLHVHFHYPELCAELLASLSANRSRCDLLLTTNSAQKARVLEEETAGYQCGGVEITTIPNRGRDIGALPDRPQQKRLATIRRARTPALQAQHVPHRPFDR